MGACGSFLLIVSTAIIRLEAKSVRVETTSSSCVGEWWIRETGFSTEGPVEVSVQECKVRAVNMVVFLRPALIVQRQKEVKDIILKLLLVPLRYCL